MSWRKLRDTLRGEPIALRLAFTVWIVYTLHFASDVSRELYLAMSLGKSASFQVDEYLGLHPDLFEIEGRGAHINNNPGASFLAAIPYTLARPVIEAVFALEPELRQPKPPIVYDDPRPNRNPFMNAVRERGLDIELGLAAASIHAGLMVPLGVAAALIVFFFLRRSLHDERIATWLALLYAFGTPIFFRSAFLNQNVLIAHAVLLAWVVAAPLAGPPDVELLDEHDRNRRLAWIGFLLGFTILCDYSGAPLALAFGLWVLWLGWRTGGAKTGMGWATRFTLGAIPPIALLLYYQWRSFGSPWLPAQVYMPDTRFSTTGWNGFFWPSPELLWRNLFDPRYGLFAFAPLLAVAVVAPFVARPNGPTRVQLGLAFGASAALYIFISSVQFALLQWNTGVRYIVPAVPLLFMAAVPVLLRLPRWALLALVLMNVAISWSVAMTRASVPDALATVFLRGPELPWLTVLRKTAAGYAPFLAGGASPVMIFAFVGCALWLVWRGAALTQPHQRAGDRR
ncbi:MAG: hypothetical protein ACREL7_11410 [Longimicrobiales bacterium]